MTKQEKDALKTERRMEHFLDAAKRAAEGSRFPWVMFRCQLRALVDESVVEGVWVAPLPDGVFTSAALTMMPAVGIAVNVGIEESMERSALIHMFE